VQDRKKANDKINLRKSERSNKSYIRGIADEFTKENLLVAVESVDDKTEKLVDLSLEGERLRLRHFGSTFYDLEIQQKEKRRRESRSEDAKEEMEHGSSRSVNLSRGAWLGFWSSRSFYALTTHV